MNAFFRNFVLNFTDVDSSGGMDTGIEDWGWFGYYGGFRFSTAPAYQFQAPTTNWATVPALLATNETRWLCSLAVDASQFSYNNCSIGSEIGVTRFIDGNNVFYDMAGNTRNIFGLPFLSTRIVWGNTSDATYALAAGNQVENIDGYFYPETEQPHFQTVRYELYRYGADWLPGLWAFSPANDTPSLICMRGYNDYYATNDAPIVMASVGSTIDLACYAKLAIQNGYPGMYAYLGQYFDRACTVDADGIATTNPAGFITTPHNSF
jgi:hypothetical protein